MDDKVKLDSISGISAHTLGRLREIDITCVGHYRSVSRMHMMYDGDLSRRDVDDADRVLAANGVRLNR